MKIINTKKLELLQIKSDRVFHDLFNEQEINTIEWVVMQILGCRHEDIKGRVRVGNVRLTNTNVKERSKYVDLIIEYQDERIIMELNNNFDGNYTRNLLYAFNTILNNYNLNDDYLLNYRELYKKVIRVVLVNLNWFKKNVDIKGKEIVSLKYPDYRMDGNILEIINVNLDYYERECYNKNNEKDKLWKLLTVKSEEELNLVTEHELLLTSYKKKLLNLSKSEEYCKEIMNENIERVMEIQRQYREGVSDGIEQGIEQGELKAKKEMILEMYNNKIDFEIIEKCSKLSKEEIEKIVKEDFE